MAGGKGAMISHMEYTVCPELMWPLVAPHLFFWSLTSQRYLMDRVCPLFLCSEIPHSTGFADSLAALSQPAFLALTLLLKFSVLGMLLCL